jgi:hypothetical protein
MNRRVFVAGLGAVLAVPLAAGAQATKRVAVLGVTPSQPVVYEMFKQGVGEFRSAGVVFVEQHADGRPDRLAAAAAISISQYCTGTAQDPHSPRRTGIVKVNVEPSPTSLLTQILPPWSSMNFRDSARPRPVPSTFLSAVPTCRNSSNTAS